MNGRELSDVLEKDNYAKRVFKGVVPRDKLADLEPLSPPALYIVNTDPSYRKGEHWVVLYFDGTGKAEYFDSFGLPPRHREMSEFLRRFALTSKHNKKCLQPVLSSTCGLYCLYYALKKSRGYSLPRIVSIFHSQKPRANDMKIKRIFRGRT